MAQLKAHEADAWLARPPAATPIVLVYGPDRGLVSERARRFAEKSGIALDDPFSVVRLDAVELDRDPGRLLDEANTMPMFAGRRLLWLRNALGQKALADAVKTLSGAMPPETLVLIEAGDLKKGAPLRSAIEASPVAMAIPCYGDDAKSIDAIIDEELRKTGLTIDSDARSLVRRRLGGDRLATRGELEKLALYAAGRGAISADDVRALSGDVSGLTADDVVDALLQGDVAAFDRGFARMTEGTAQVYTMLSGAQRQLQMLHALRGMVDRGGSVASVVASARPPVFFTRRRLVEQALERWDTTAIARMLERLQEAVLATRRNPALASGLAHRALLGIAIDAARKQRAS